MRFKEDDQVVVATTEDTADPGNGGGGLVGGGELVGPAVGDSVGPGPRQKTQRTQDPVGVDSSNPLSRRR